mmetsp:Transcript_75217/g.121420  ORF Transcript_75217/g.121420 Transcript_75217/m.121420 type:complete len:282 (+) Transcript_75217:73-918(+)
MSMPLLNYDDAPEALMASPRRVRLYLRHNVSGRRQKQLFATATKSLKSVPESPDDLVMETDHECEPVAESEVQWACVQCTFLNADAMPMCEACHASRLQAQSPKPRCSSAENEDSLLPEDDVAWPSVSEAGGSWALCDVSSVCSSVGSSWLDVSDPRELDDGTSSSQFVLVECLGAESPAAAVEIEVPPASSATPGTGLSWAARVSAPPSNSSDGAVNKITVKLSTRMLPPLCYQGPARKATLRPRDEGDDEEVQQLEDKRLCPSTLRGKTQRLRSKKVRG